MDDCLDLLVISHSAVLGVNQLVYAELLQRGWRIGVITPNRWQHQYSERPLQTEFLPDFEQNVLRKHVAMRGRPQRYFYLARSSRSVTRLRPRTLFCEEEPFSVATAQWGMAAWRHGVPFGVQMAENQDRPMPAVARLLRRQILSRAAYVAARSPSAASLAQKWGAKGRVQVVPHHVPPWPNAVRTSSGIFTIGYAGRLVPEKGLDTLVSAARLLHFPFKLLVVGNGPMRDWLETQDLGHGRLELAKDISHAQMSEAYSQMDVLVLPSRTTSKWSEQFGRVLVEALHCGTAVVGSDSGEIPWVITTTTGGWVFPEGNEITLAQLLAELHKAPALCANVGARGQKAVVDQFSVRAAADTLEALLELREPHRRRREEPRRPAVALVVHNVDSSGGMERVCSELIRHLAASVRFTVISSTLPDDLKSVVERWIPIRVPNRPIPLKFLLFYVRAALSLQRQHVDLTHSVGAVVPNHVDIASIHFCHAGFIASTGGLAPEGAPVTRRLNTSIARLLALGAEHWTYRPARVRVLVAVSEAIKQQLAVHYPTVPSIVIRNGVDLEQFSPDAEVREAIRSREDIGDELVALFVGGNWNHKGLFEAIQAIQLVRRRGVDMRLWVVGDGDRKRFTYSDHPLDGQSEAVRFFGRRADVQDFYKAADLFILPSSYEAFSLVALEAAASGLPLVVTPRSGEAPAIVGSQDAGRIVEGNPDSIAAALLELGLDKALRQKLGAQARSRSIGSTWQAMANSTLDLYNSLIAREATALPSKSVFKGTQSFRRFRHKR